MQSFKIISSVKKTDYFKIEAFLLFRTFKGYLLLSLIVFLLVGPPSTSGNSNWVELLIFLFCYFLYELNHYKIFERSLKKGILRDEMIWSMTDGEVEVTGADGYYRKVSWSKFKKVRSYKEYILLFYDRQNFFLLKPKEVNEAQVNDIVRFIRSRLSQTK